MVKASDINKDIRSISQKVGVAFFSYDDIHNASINNQFHYDYNRVIQTVSVLQKITPEEAEKRLVDRGILQLLPGEEYAINVGGTTRGGGGINYGEAFFFLSDKDYHTKYHELAHSLQNKYTLFDDEKLNALYDKSKKSLKPNENSEDKLLDKKNYAIYLNEMHSEVFGYGALLLRAENKRDFFKHALLAYRSGLDRNAVGFLSFGKTGYGCNGENSSKFYVTKSVMKPMIKAVWKIHKEGKKGEYFDENGVLNDEKFAKLCEDIVLKNAYSPRTLKSFFDYNIGDTHSSQEKGWRRDTFESLVSFPLVSLESFEKSTIETLKSIYKHKRLVAAENKILKKFVLKENNSNNPELRALKEYERLQVKLLLLDKKFPKNDVGIFIKSKFSQIVKNRMPDSFIRISAELLSVKKSERVVIEKELKSIRELVQKNKYNSYFNKLMESNVSTVDLKNMLQNKLKNPDVEVTAGLTANDKSYGLATYPLRRQIKKIQNFADEYGLPLETKNTLLETAIKTPTYLENKEFRNNLVNNMSFSNDFLGLKARKCKNDFDKLLDGVVASNYNNVGNPAYQEVLVKMSKLPVDRYEEEIDSMENQEREARKNKNIVKTALDLQIDTENKMSVLSQKQLTPEEEVQKELAELGVDKKSYLMLTAKDKDLKVGYGNEQGNSIAGYFDRQEEAAKIGASKLMGSNNGMTAVYFAKQNIYVVAPSYDLRNAMKRSEGCADVGYGVMFSNGERFTNNDFMNNKLDNVKNYVKGAEEIKKREAERDGMATLSETKRVDDNVASEQIQSNEAIIDKSKAENGGKKDNSQNSQINNFENLKSSDKNISSDKAEKVSAMAKKEKGSFFHNLRLGVNTILVGKSKKTLQSEKNLDTQKQQKSNSNINIQVLNKIKSNVFSK